jgi:hypothetical protein
MAEHGEHDDGDLADRQFPPPRSDGLEMSAQ